VIVCWKWIHVAEVPAVSTFMMQDGDNRLCIIHSMHCAYYYLYIPIYADKFHNFLQSVCLC